MAGFFSLGGTSTNNNNPPQDPNNEINPEPFYLYTPTSRNQEISHNYPYNKGTFDLWQNPPPHPQTHQQQRSQNPLMLQDLYSLAVGSSGRGVGSGSGGGGGGINVYDGHSRSMVEGGGGFMVMASTSNSGSGTISCQDCGNQAKKDCVHRRCRSCCKTRGYECPTHIKSTWVPAAKRRERQQQIVGVLQQEQQQIVGVLQQEQQQQQQQQITNNISSSRDNYPQQIPKRVRDHRSNPSSSGLEVPNLPAEVNKTAVFRCVRVSSVDNSEDQFAYQTAVSIGGHTFKGILYDQGPVEATNYVVAGDTSSGVSGGNIPARLNRTTSTSTSSPGGTTTNASQFLSNYQTAAPQNYPFMAGTQFFQHQNPRS